MKTYYVTIPIAGRLLFKVEAKNKASAKAAAWDKYNVWGEHDAEDVEWETYESIASGNECHAPYNQVEVQEVKNGA